MGGEVGRQVVRAVGEVDFETMVVGVFPADADVAVAEAAFVVVDGDEDGAARVPAVLAALGVGQQVFRVRVQQIEEKTIVLETERARRGLVVADASHTARADRIGRIDDHHIKTLPRVLHGPEHLKGITGFDPDPVAQAICRNIFLQVCLCKRGRIHAADLRGTGCTCNK